MSQDSTPDSIELTERRNQASQAQHNIPNGTNTDDVSVNSVPQTDPDGETDSDNETDPNCTKKYRVRKSQFCLNASEGEDSEQYSRADNPFYLAPQHEVMNIAQRVACEYGLISIEHLFIKAAFVLANPDEANWTWGDLPGLSTAENTALQLTEEEKQILREERHTNFWNQPWPLKTTFLMLFVAASVQGWTQTATNGANLTWPEHFGLVNSTTPAPTSSNTGAPSRPSCGPVDVDVWKFAAVNAAPYLAASVGCWFSDPIINEWLWGRRGAIAASALLIFSAAILGASARTYWWLLASRLLLGLGMGCKAAVVPVFAAEVAPTHMRGKLVMNWQVFDAFGIFLGFSANLVAWTQGKHAKPKHSSDWRWQLASSAIPAFVLLWSVAYVCWDSPRFLMKHEKQYRERYKKRKQAWERAQHPGLRRSPTIPSEQSLDNGFGKQLSTMFYNCLDIFRRRPAPQYRSETYETLVLLRGHPLLAAKELVFAHCQLLVETFDSQTSDSQDMDFSLESRTTWLERLLQLASKPYIRREVYAAAVVMLSQQLCGINVLILYSSSLYCNTGGGKTTSIAPLWQTWGVGLANFIFALPAYGLIDSLGRRPLLLATLPFMAVAMAIAAASIRISNALQLKIVLTTFTYVFTALYSPGLGPVPFTLSAEVFPLEHRMVGMSLAVSLNFLGLGLLTLLVPRVQDQAHLLGTFAGLNIAAFIFVWIYVREPAKDPATKETSRMTSLSLEELYKVFHFSTRIYFEYQCQRILPYCWGLAISPITGSQPDKPEPFTTFGEKRSKEREAQRLRRYSERERRRQERGRM